MIPVSNSLLSPSESAALSEPLAAARNSDWPQIVEVAQRISQLANVPASQRAQQVLQFLEQCSAARRESVVELQRLLASLQIGETSRRADALVQSATPSSVICAGYQDVDDRASNCRLRHALAYSVAEQQLAKIPEPAGRALFYELAFRLRQSICSGYFAKTENLFDRARELVGKESGSAEALRLAEIVLDSTRNDAINEFTDDQVHIAHAFVEAMKAIEVIKADKAKVAREGGAILYGEALESWIAHPLAACSTLKEAEAFMSRLETQLASLPAGMEKSFREQLRPMMDYFSKWFSAPEAGPARHLFKRLEGDEMTLFHLEQRTVEEFRTRMRLSVSAL